ncbi:M23 family metallopeptidase [Lapillicoccus jejuensis]|uniref:M23 family metallopeptidase n=1 Tax=Lapillicoccus jejuensis TaxID=402171 RepID=UPI0011524542|nr:M23 family metallopeptidase [Lapillicoccus jejuensis]
MRSTVRRRTAAVAAAVLGAAVLGVVAPQAGSADTGDDKKAADQRAAAAANALEDISGQLVGAWKAYNATAAQLPAAQKKLDTASALERAAQQRNDAVAAQLSVAQANEARAVEQQQQNAAQLQQTQDALDGFAADVFQGGGDSQLAVALGTQSAGDFADRLVMADTVTSLTNSAITDLQNARAEDAAQKAYLTSVRAQIAALKVQAQQALAAATTAREDAASAKASLDRLVATERSQLAALNAQKAAEQGRLAAAQADQARLQAMLVEQARRAAAAAAAARAKGAYVAVQGGTGFLSRPGSAPITSPFGLRFHPILHVWKLHTGTDFGMACGTPVYAAADGTVLSAGWGGGDGNRIVIDHGIVSGVDLASTYNHLSRFVVTGGHVSRGQLIAYSGTTGYSTGCHLHFETLENGSFVNPMTWLS